MIPFLRAVLPLVKSSLLALRAKLLPPVVLIGCGLCFLPVVVWAQTGTALVQHAPVLNGTVAVNGSIQQMAGENVTLNGSASISGDLLVPGTPTVTLVGHPVFGGVVVGSGSAAPTNYTVILNGSPSLGHLRTRTNPAALPVVSAPPVPVGTRNVTLTAAGQSVGSFATLNNLTLNGTAGQVAIPAGTYGTFTANGNGGFTLGVAGAAQPSAYNLQSLVLNGTGQIQILGPVVLTVGGNVTLNGATGSTVHPEWFVLNVASGSININGSVALNAFVTAPSCSVTLNGSSQLIGGLVASQLTLNGTSIVRLQAAATTPQPPVAASQSVTTAENTAATITLVATQANNDPLTYTAGAPSHGTLSGTAPNLTYTPATNYFGADSFTFTAKDGTVVSNTATVSITVTKVNYPPVAASQSVTTAENAALAVTLTATQTNNDLLTYTVVTQPAHGTLSGIAPNLTYTPATNYFGADSFTFTAKDGTVVSNTATVSITVTKVNYPPVAVNQSVTTNENASTPITLNATQANGDALTYSYVTASHGTLSGTAPNLTYTPATNYYGADSFTFTAKDGSVVSNTATVSITVTKVNYPPVVANQSVTTAENAALAIVLGATQTNNDALTYAASTPSHGTLSGTAPNLTYTPATNYFGTDSFTFTATANGIVSNTATMSITVTKVNYPPVANNQSVTTAENAATPITLVATQVNGDALTYTASTPSHGTLSGTAPNLTYTPATNYFGTDSFTFTATANGIVSNTATVSITVTKVNYPPVANNQSVTTLENAALAIVLGATQTNNDALTYAASTPSHGTLSGMAPNLIYTPAANYFGTDSFTFTANDGTVSSNTATVSITVTKVNYPPVATPQSVTTAENAATPIMLVATQINGDPLTYSYATASHGTLSGTAPNLTYTPATNYFGTDSFTFTANDGTVVSNTATVSITVTKVNYPPVAVGQNVSTNTDTPLPIVLGGSDVNGDALSFTVMTQPQHGTLTGAAPNLTYIPVPGFNGSDSFTFTVNDGTFDAAPATVAINVFTRINTAPVVNAGPDQIIYARSFSNTVGLGRLVICNDEWYLSDRAFAAAPTTENFARNLVKFLANGRPGRFLARCPVSYRGFAESRFLDVVNSQGYTMVVDVSTPPTLAYLRSFDAVFVDAVFGYDASALTQYVKEGGSVFMTMASGGLGAATEAAVNNPFLLQFGLQAASVWNGFSGVYPVVPGAPLTEGVTGLFFEVGASLSILPPADPTRFVIQEAGNYGVVGFDGFPDANTVMNGSVTDDGLPMPAHLTNLWTLVSGQADAVRIMNSGALDTKVGFTQPGDYVFKLQSTDGELGGEDTVSIRVLVNNPPIVSAGPDRGIYGPNQSITLAGTASDDGRPLDTPLSVRWTVKSAPAGSTVDFGTPNALTTTAAFSQAGIYVLELQADDSLEVSSDTMEVRVGMSTEVALPPGLMAWWPGNGTTEDVVSGIFGTSNNLGYGAGKVGDAFSVAANSRMLVPARPGVDIGAQAAGFTIEFWINPSSAVADYNERRLFSWVDSGGTERLRIHHYSADDRLRFQDANGQSFDLYGMPKDTWTHVAYAYDKAAQKIYCYINGLNTLTVPANGFALATGGDLYLGGSAGTPSNIWFSGKFDEVSFYNRPLDKGEMAQIYNAGIVGKAPLSANQPPVVNAGTDTGIPANTGSVTLYGIASDDGLPVGSVLFTQWKQLFGPVPATIVSPNALQTDVNFTVPGIYGFQLSADDGLARRSDTVEVRVGMSTEVALPSGLLAWWPGDGTTKEVVSGIFGTPINLGYASGKVGDAFNVAADGLMLVPARPGVDIGAQAAGFTVEFWINPSSAVADYNERRLFSWVDSGGTERLRIHHYSADDRLRFQDANGQSFDLYGMPKDTWTHVAYAYDKAAQKIYCYVNGLNTLTVNANGFALATSGDLYLGGSATVPSNIWFSGKFDEVSFYNRPLDKGEMAQIYNAGIVGKAPLSANQPPVVNAGTDKSIPGNSGSITLHGIASDDGLPGAFPLFIQWKQLFGPATAGMGSPNQLDNTVNFTTPGIYGFQLSADDGLARRSDTVEVRVGMSTASPLPSGLMAWWPGNGTTEDVVSGLFGTSNNLGYGTGKVGIAFNVAANGLMLVPARPGVDIGAQAAGFTIEFWINPSSAVADYNERRLFSWVDSGGTERLRIHHYSADDRLRFQDANGQSFDLYGMPKNTWTHVAYAYDKAAQKISCYINGLNTLTVPAGGFALATGGDLYLGGSAGTPSNNWFSGKFDEVSFYNRPLTAAEINAVYAANENGKTPYVRNNPPVVTASVTDSPVVGGAAAALSATAVDDGLPTPPAALTYLWSKVSGPGNVTFTASTSLNTSATFSAAGSYVLKIDVSDSELSASATVNVNVASAPPAVAITSPTSADSFFAGQAVQLTATASDPDGTIAKVEFFDGATKLGETSTSVSGQPSTFAFALTSGLPSGSHSLTARATDNSTLSTTSTAVVINVSSVTPVVSLTSPADGSSVAAAVPVALKATATIAYGTIAKVEFFDGTTKLGEQTVPDTTGGSVFTFTQTTGFSEGTHALTAKVTSAYDATAASGTVNITAFVYTGPTAIKLVDPADDTRISAPISVTGIVAHPTLSSWALERRLKVAEGAPVEPWAQFATGSNFVGTPENGATAEVPGVLGTFDPTSLLNGIYEIRLVVNTSTSTLSTTPNTVVVEGNMKVGAFTLAFEDLKVPVAGIPISIVRTYDSRDTRVGDFGPGWQIAVNNIRVQKNRHLGLGWYQTEPPFTIPPFFPFYVEPVLERIVTVTMPDGESHRFRAGAYVKSPTRIDDPDNVSIQIPAINGRLKFYALGDTTSTLEPLDNGNQLFDKFYLLGVGNQDLFAGEYGDFNDFPIEYNVSRYRLTTKDGTKYIVDETLGLMQMEDLNGNTLVLNRDAQNRVTSLVSTQAAPSGPIATTITIHRDATGRVDYIRDLAGNDLDYLYDASGRLASFTNRELNVTQFKYENAAFPYYLTKIIDPRGVTALRSEFDANGKLIKQIDADGKETVFSRGIDATGRFEKIKDRLGHETSFYYDDRGNVTTKIDPLGAITTFSYYPDGDWVKFETDHYGNTKSMAYDARGNVTVQTIGASLTEDPANPTTGYTTRTAYNDRSAPTLIIDPAGRTQSFSYDATTGNLLSNTVGFGGTAPATTTYHYNTDGTLDTVTDALGTVTSNTYDYSFSSPDYPGAIKQTTVTVSDSGGTVLRTSRTIYDAQENMLATIATRTLPAGGTEDIVTKYVYDSENRLTATIMPDGKVSETRYTSFGQTDKSLLWKSVADYQSHNDSLARVTSYGYDNRGNQVSTTYPDGTSESSSFDLENRRQWSQDAMGRTTYFTYDDVGRLRFTIQPDNTPADLTDNPYTETVYDLTGRVTDTYDELRHRTTVTYYADGTPDAGRRRQSIQVLSTGNLTTSYQYDATGAVRFVTDPRGNTIETVYDDQGRPTTVKYPATDENPATQSSTKYDILGRRVETTDQEGKVMRYRYDALGRLFEVRQYLDTATAASDTLFQISNSNPQIVM